MTEDNIAQLSDDDKAELIKWLVLDGESRDPYTLTIEFMVPPRPQDEAHNLAQPSMDDGRRIDNVETWRWSVYFREHSSFSCSVEGYGPTLKAAFDQAQKGF